MRQGGGREGVRHGGEGGGCESAARGGMSLTASTVPVSSKARSAQGTAIIRGRLIAIPGRLTAGALLGGALEVML